MLEFRITKWLLAFGIWQYIGESLVPLGLLGSGILRGTQHANRCSSSYEPNKVC